LYELSSIKLVLEGKLNTIPSRKCEAILLADDPNPLVCWTTTFESKIPNGTKLLSHRSWIGL